MRLMLDTVPMDGVVVIGEGEKDEAPMLYNGERIGDGSPPEVDIAVDPLEGTRLTAQGQPSALSVIALAERGTMFDPGPCVYMEKIAGGPADRRLPQPRRPADRGDRPRRRAQGHRARRRDDHHARPPAPRGSRERDPRGRRPDPLHHRRRRRRGAVRGHRGDAASTCCGGSAAPPKGVLSAAAIKCLGGQLLGRLWPRDDGERKAALDAGYDLDRVLDGRRPGGGNDVFFAATGVTDGDLIAGRALPRRRPRHDRVAGDALALRHRPRGPRPPRPPKAARGDGRVATDSRGEAARRAGEGGRAPRATAERGPAARRPRSARPCRAARSGAR